LIDTFCDVLQVLLNSDVTSLISFERRDHIWTQLRRWTVYTIYYYLSFSTTGVYPPNSHALSPHGPAIHINFPRLIPSLRLALHGVHIFIYVCTVSSLEFQQRG